MIWNDYGAQLDFFNWLQMHMQEDREKEIRDHAEKYATSQLGGHNRVQMIYQTAPLALISPSPQSPTAASVSMRYNEVLIDIHPAVQGFARQLLAEMAIREQLDLCHEPGDD